MSDFNGIDITRKAIDAMKNLGADKSQASLSMSEQSEFNIDIGRLSLYRTTTNMRLSITAYKDNKKGSANISKCDDESIKAAALSAIESAKSSEPDAANDISPYHAFESFRNGDKAPDNDLMFSRLKDFLNYTSATYPITKLEQCILDFSYGQSFYSNSNGTDFEERGGAYNFFAMFTSKKGTDTSSFNYSGASHRGLKSPLHKWGYIDELMRQSAEQTKISTVDNTFSGDLIITPECISSFLSFLNGVYLSDYPLITGVSPWKNNLGQKVISPLITINSVPLGPNIEIGYSYTGDGFKAENCYIIQDGVLKNFTLGLYGSNKTGIPRCPSGGGAIMLESGNSNLSDMIKDVKKGIMLSRFSGGNPSSNGDFSGVAKNSYLIENGKIIRPVGETMIAGNIEAFFNSVRAVSKESINYGSSVMPWVLAGPVSISGH